MADSSKPAEDQAQLDAVPIQESGEPLVDFLALAPTTKLLLSPHHPVFEFPRVHLLRESVAKMVIQAANALPNGLRLQIVEGYRPIQVQREHFKHSLAEARKRMPGASEEEIQLEAGRYSAPPDAPTPPPHTTGGAVDLEIIDENDERLDFFSPLPLDDMRGAAMESDAISDEAKKNRALLRSILEPTGLTNYADEWWHWSYGDNGWALRVNAPCAMYGPIDLPADALWVGDLDKLPASAVDGEF
ncbi:D-alanyl-D-alanine dipeptidase [Abditibacteriota bacterium]|nr:D-alanyl-D-alanine dipeptidase [Abditibacteriota bacterium]